MYMKILFCFDSMTLTFSIIFSCDLMRFESDTKNASTEMFHHALYLIFGTSLSPLVATIWNENTDKQRQSSGP